jgi:ABC-type transporter MlaC component
VVRQIGKGIQQMALSKVNNISAVLGLLLLAFSLVSVAKVVTKGAATDAAEQRVPAEQIHQELSEIVAAFNTHAQRLDTQDPALVGGFITFIGDSLAKHWDTRDMAIRLLGAEAFGGLSRAEQQQIGERLEMTFHRYALEVLEEYRQSPMALTTELIAADEAGLWRVKIRAKPRILPAMTGDLYLKAAGTGWAIVDAGYAGFTYVSLKDSSYQRQLERHGVAGLLAWLDEKNAEFFSAYCRPELVSVMPLAVLALCLSPM